MKQAFVHDWIVTLGGAEQVLIDLIRQYRTGSDQIQIFTLFSNRRYLTIDGMQYPIITALPYWMFQIIDRFRIHRIPLLSRLCDYRNLMVIFPGLVARLSRQIAQYQADRTIVSSFAVVKNVSLMDRGLHILYAHSPCMYVHNHYHANYHRLPYILKPVYRWVSSYIRKRDMRPVSYDMIYVNSRYTMHLMHTIYGLDSILRYPALDHLFEHIRLPVSAERYPRLMHKPYCIMIGRLVKFARKCDTVIRLCNDLQIDLVVCGEGPDQDYLQEIAGDTIHFVGHISNIQTKISRIAHAQCLINLTLESFGIVTAEALALGIPVLANREGASKELVGPRSGILTNPDDDVMLRQDLLSLLKQHRNPQDIQDDFWKQYRSGLKKAL